MKGKKRKKEGRRKDSIKSPNQKQPRKLNIQVSRRTPYL